MAGHACVLIEMIGMFRSDEAMVNMQHVAPTKFIRKFVAASRSACVKIADDVAGMADVEVDAGGPIAEPQRSPGTNQPVKISLNSTLCYAQGSKGSALHCRFHPNKPLLAVALSKGRVVIFFGEDSSRFSQWKSFNADSGDTNSDVHKIEWSV